MRVCVYDGLRGGRGLGKQAAQVSIGHKRRWGKHAYVSVSRRREKAMVV